MALPLAWRRSPAVADAASPLLRAGGRDISQYWLAAREAPTRRALSSHAVGTTHKRLRMRAESQGPGRSSPVHRLGICSSRSASSAPRSQRPSTDPSPDSDEPPALPFLPRPLGVPNPPDTRSKTWQQKKDELMDQDLRLAKRRALVKEATQGYFHDYHSMSKAGGHAGKTWVAPSVLIREDRALYFPNISGTSLAASRQTVHTTDLCRGKVSIVAVLNTRISEEHVNSFIADALTDWEGKEGFAYVQINHQPNPLKSLLLTFSMSNLRRTMREDRWPNYMYAGGEWGGLKQPLGISNKHVGYVYLVDPNLKIRWAGCGYAEASEAEGLRRALGVLMGRWKEAQKAGR